MSLVYTVWVACDAPGCDVSFIAERSASDSSKEQRAEARENGWRVEVKPGGLDYCAAHARSSKQPSTATPVEIPIDLMTLSALLARTTPEPIRGCLIWNGAISREGYGKVWAAGRSWGAHRVAYTLGVGPIPPGLQIDHLCRNRQCVNPVHLEPVTGRENTARGLGVVAAGIRAFESGVCRNGHVLAEVGIRNHPKAGRSCVACTQDRLRLRRQRVKGLAS